MCATGLQAGEQAPGSWKPKWLSPPKTAQNSEADWTSNAAGNTASPSRSRPASRSTASASRPEGVPYQRTESRFARTEPVQRAVTTDTDPTHSSLVIKTAATDAVAPRTYPKAASPKATSQTSPARRSLPVENHLVQHEAEPELISEELISKEEYEAYLAQNPIGQPADDPPMFERAPEASLSLDCVAERQKLKPIDAITSNIAAEPGEFPPECNSPGNVFEPRDWNEITYTWKASGLCHKPLYFEDWNLERYGHALPPGIQQVSSAAHFLGAGALLPYKMAMDPPWECQYPLGFYRPSSCAPYMIRPFPGSVRGGIGEAAAVTGLIFLIP